MKKFWLAASLFIAIQATWATAWAADFAEAEQLLTSGDAAGALQTVEAALASDPTNADGRFLQGIALANLGRADDAIEVFRDLTQDYREIPEPYNNLAVLLAQKGDFNGARDALEAAVDQHPNYTAAWENLADIYSILATIAYETVLQQEPTNSIAQYRLAQMSGSAQAQATPQPVAPAPAAVATAKPAAPAPVAVPVPVPAPAPVAIASVEEAAEAVEEAVAEAKPVVEEAVTAIEPEAAPSFIRKPVSDTRISGATVAMSAPLSAKQQPIMDAVNKWANDWANQDIEGYLSAYSDNYEPQENKTRAEWISQRRARLAAPGEISIKISQPSVLLLDDELATVKFLQDYRSDKYQDSVRKTLLLERYNGTWVIVREQSIR